MKAVLDTNILVSGLIKPSGPSGTVIQMAVAGRFQVCYDARILLEYHLVLARPNSRLIPPKQRAYWPFLRPRGS